LNKLIRDLINNESILCPSAQCEDGAILLGVVRKDGHISFISKKVVIDEEFVSISHIGRSPEKRFRFADTCVKAACKHWTSDRCKVIDNIVDILANQTESSKLPDCSIREQCRWFKQLGSKACAVCPEIITDLHPEVQS
jgi:hypothetical protein